MRLPSLLTPVVVLVVFEFHIDRCIASPQQETKIRHLSKLLKNGSCPIQAILPLNFTVKSSTSGIARNDTGSLSVAICGSRRQWSGSCPGSGRRRTSCCSRGGRGEIGHVGLTRRACNQVPGLGKRREIVGVDVVLA